MPPTIAARWITCEQPLEAAQIAGVDLAALAHPLRRRALVGDADLPVGVGDQAAHDSGADRAGAAGDEDAVHGRLRLAAPWRPAPFGPPDLRWRTAASRGEGRTRVFCRLVRGGARTDE